jgi:hypothetical protein
MIFSLWLYQLRWEMEQELSSGRIGGCSGNALLTLLHAYLQWSGKGTSKNGPWQKQSLVIYGLRMPERPHPLVHWWNTLLYGISSWNFHCSQG